MLVVGIACRTSNAPDAGPQDIPRLWQRFFSESISSLIPNKVSKEVIALYCDYDGDHTMPYSVVIGCPVSSHDDIPKGMVAKTIPAKSYALFRAVGTYPQSLIETWQHIWHEHSLKRTYTGDYEVYGIDAPKEVEVFVAI